MKVKNNISEICRLWIYYADMVKLADTSDLGSDAHWVCRFKSCCPYQSYCGYNDNNSTLLIIFEVRKAPDAPFGEFEMMGTPSIQILFE